jgi:hypothetical protein
MKRLLFAIALVAAGTPARAEVVRVVVDSRTPIPGDFGTAGSYELVRGRYYGELDPAAPGNRIITDLDLAPRNARGKVEYSATFALSKPVNMARASGVLFYDVPNRGNGEAAGDPAGHVHVISGWQGDIAPDPRLQIATVPTARSPDGSSITGPVLVRIVDPPAGGQSVSTGTPIYVRSRDPLTGAPVTGRSEAIRPEPVTLDTAKAQLLRKRNDADAGEVVPPSDWAFADCADAPFPGKAAPGQVCVKGGFDPRFAYELAYTAKDPLVLGIGFAAVRDLVTFLGRSADTPEAPNPVSGRVRWAMATGQSQSGNFLRSFVHLGFNQGEDGKAVFAAIHPTIAARQLALNLRFGNPTGAVDLYEPGSEGVLWWGSHRDLARGRGKNSLFARCSVSKTCPKVVETVGSAEFWNLRLSPNFVGLEAKADIPLPANVRRYYLPGVTHGGGEGGFSTPAPFGRCLLPANPNPTAPTVRALTKAMVDWVVKGVPPPPSRYPSLAHGDLVEPTSGALGFPAIPGAPRPDGKMHPTLIYDFGSGLRQEDLSGMLDRLPPAIIARAPSLAPRVNQDGNETSGVPSVQHRTPLGTYLGWNARTGGYYAGGGCGFAGGYIPFARTKAARLSAGDPRLSLEERYGTSEAFVAKITAAARQMVAERLLLPEDAAQVIKDAAASDVLR